MENKIPSRQRTLYVASLVDNAFRHFMKTFPPRTVDAKLRTQWTIYFLNHRVWFARQVESGLIRLTRAKRDDWPELEEFVAWCLAPPVSRSVVPESKRLQLKATSIQADANKPKRPCPLRDVLNKYK